MDGTALQGKAILVTGAGRSLGAAMSDYFESQGATVVRTDIVPAYGVIHHDVTERGDWEAVVARMVANHGRIDGLVNNAAVFFGMRPFWDESDDEFARLLNVNVMGTWLGIQIVSREMATRSRGSIVNFSSTSGVMATPGFAGYGTSRWAVRGLTKFAAGDLASRGLRVNSIHPHGIRGTGMVGPPGTEAEERARDRNNPLGRMGTTDDVSAVVSFLLSDASTWITGREFVLDGGASLTAAV